ncbi:glucose-1-phosphate adenylyltransferase [Solicola gregarius]|uniref:Glucose-1-phosphate adenylyltransferase n=1 Tax=Solicola gregarius TaxID=2908642 RepID=A0AA46TML2_9ACTN|nr:glucose-1-phosphate adenylyltransferase [Solicola gregarius]UYM07178.1 glucose-1-phosphate adenylyltransferase [Solicola gregarius]
MRRTRNPSVLAIVLAGGEGKRLLPLTADRAKPAVPFGGTYRLIDFTLSNIVNSGYLQVIVLTQYKSHSLDRHISTAWRLPTMLDEYVAPVPAQQRVGKRWYLGSADAIYQSLNLIRDARPDLVLVAGADHVYRMDFSQLVAAHRETGAAATVGAIRRPIGEAGQLGVIEVDPTSPRRIVDFREKPAAPVPLPDSPHEVLASMGNYVFETDALVEAVSADARNESTNHDMGGDVVPALAARGEAAVYDFRDNDVAGSYNRDRDYWRDVGTLESYHAAHMDLVSPLPVFNLYNYEWPTYTHYGPHPPAKLVRGANGEPARTEDAIVSAGAVITGGTVRESVLSPRCFVDADAVVTDSVLLDEVYVGKGAQVHNAILDKGVSVPAGMRIGDDAEADRANGLIVQESGLVVAEKGLAF